MPNEPMREWKVNNNCLDITIEHINICTNQPYHSIPIRPDDIVHVIAGLIKQKEIVDSKQRKLSVMENI